MYFFYLAFLYPLLCSTVSFEMMPYALLLGRAVQCYHLTQFNSVICNIRSTSRTGVPETEKDRDMKPRSLRFTWSMKTTSAMDPNDMMKEIRKVGNLLICWLRHYL